MVVLQCVQKKSAMDKYTIQEIILFNELLQVSLGNRFALSKIPSAKVWNELFSLSKSHALIGICFSGIQKIVSQHQVSDLPINLKMQWLGITTKTQQQNKLMNERCVELQYMLKNEGFCTYIMKGQGNAALYPFDLSSLRQPGDIDIYLDGGYEKVINFVNRTYPTKNVNGLEVRYHCFKDVEVEIHYKPFIVHNPFRNSKLQMFFATESKRCYENFISLGESGCISVPTIEFNLVHQMVHIWHHLFTEGVGLRQLMDYYFLVLKANEHVLTTDYKSIIHTLKLDCFASALMWTLGEVYGLKRERMLWKPNEKDGKFLLKEIMQMGNFGRADIKQRGIYTSRWKSFWYVHFKTFRYWRFDHFAWFWSPLMRIKGFLWRKINGYR